MSETALQLLEPEHTNQKSFYKKAHVRTTHYSTYVSYRLYSYDTLICELGISEEGLPLLLYLTPTEWHFSNTTRIHLNEFMQQHNLPKRNKAYWLELSEHPDMNTFINEV